MTLHLHNTADASEIRNAIRTAYPDKGEAFVETLTEEIGAKLANVRVWLDVSGHGKLLGTYLD